MSGHGPALATLGPRRLCVLRLKEYSRMGLHMARADRRCHAQGPSWGRDAGGSSATAVGSALHALHKGPSDPPETSLLGRPEAGLPGNHLELKR